MWLWGAAVLVAGCSFILELDEQPCSDNQQCSLNGTSYCLQGVCVPNGAAAASNTNAVDTDGSATANATEDASTSTNTPDPESTGDDPLVGVIQNGDFEDGTIGWTVHGEATISSTTEQARNGQRSALVRNRSEDWEGLMAIVTDRAREGVPYLVSGYVLVADETVPTSPVKLSFKLHCAEDSGPQYLTLYEGVATNTEWAEVLGTMEIPTGCDAVEAAFYFEGVLGGAVTEQFYPNFYVDDVVVEE